MKDLFIDIETYSEVSIDNGVYAYSACSKFKILLFAYCEDGGAVKCVDLKHGEELPTHIVKALDDPAVIKHAFNANFERVCLSRWLPMYRGLFFLDPAQWHCTMVACAYNGLPMSLKSAGKALNIEHKKLDEGKELIKRFCVPNPKGKSLLDGEDWEMFKRYNIRDVEAELQIHYALPFTVPDTVWRDYAVDQRINDCGVHIDYQLVINAIKCNNEVTDEYYTEMKQLTGLDNPKSVTQLRQWLSDKGVDTDSLDKAAVADLMKKVPPDIRRVLVLRSLLSKSSVKKYETMLDLWGEGGRARGCFQYYGSHTGRWAGRHIQLQNLPQNHMKDLESVRKLVRDGDLETLELFYDNIPQILSELIRTAITAEKGNTLCVADFSAIEARVIAWLAGEQWRVDVFRSGGDIYCASASAMFKVPVEKNGVNGHLRQKGKVAELALGYGGSVGALKAFGAVEMGVPEEELDGIVKKWREASPNIVKLWYEVDKAAKSAIISNKLTKLCGDKVKIGAVSDALVIVLPSKRKLIYQHPEIGTNKFGGDSIIYKGVNSVRKWSKIETMGARLVENIVQAVARDLLAEAMNRLTELGYKIVAHVHDEVIIEVPKGKDELDAVIKAMCELPQWADEGLVLNAAGFVSDFYKKD